MKKQFDSVFMMRKIRLEISERYSGKPALEQQELQEAKARFKAQLSNHASRIAEDSVDYGNSADGGSE
jgi:hypothetical protein